MKEGELGKIYSDGEVIFKEGDKGEMMYVIQSGKVKITKQTSTGNLDIATLESGDILGEMSLFDKMPRSATARASGDARVLSIDRKKLFVTISRDPTLVFKILETMSQRIRALNSNLSELKKDKSDMLTVYFNMEDTCNMILEEARNIIKAENGSIMLIDDQGILTIKAAFGNEAGKKLHFGVGEGIAGDVLKKGQAELVNNVTMDSRFKTGATNITSLLCVPLKCAAHNIGVINMSLGSEKLFTIDDLKLLHCLAAYASVAIHNAQNFSNLRNSTDKVLSNVTILDAC